MSYIFFVDESGNVTQESGISDEVGPSRYMSMGGFLVHESDLKSVGELLDELRDRFRKKKNLHATELSHVQKIHLIRELNGIEPKLFGVVSDKSTLRGFKKKSEGSPQDYYNRTALYVLSLLGRYLRSQNIDGKNVRIIFERRDHDYRRLQNYVRRVKQTPDGDEVDGIEEITPSRISSAPKEEHHQFAVPDLVAHSIFSAFDRNRNNFKITEPRYLDEMMGSFLGADGFARLHLIQADRMKNVCEPTVQMLASYGLKVG